MNAGLKPSVVPHAAEVPTVLTPRLLLRPLQRSDAGLIAHYTADRRLAENTRAIPHPLPPRATEAWVAHAMSPESRASIWAIDGSKSALAEVLGVISLTPVVPGQCELEFWIGPGLWNSGFATEAVEALVAENPLGCRSLVAEVFQDNPGSARVLTNCGFEYLGDAESWSVARDTRVPTWTYARTLA